MQNVVVQACHSVQRRMKCVDTFMACLCMVWAERLHVLCCCALCATEYQHLALTA